MFTHEMILPIFEGLRWALFLFTKWPARLNTLLILRVHTMLEWQDIFWLKCLILDIRLHFFPVTTVLLSQYILHKSKQHHVIAANAYLLFRQKSTNLTILFLVFTVLIILLMDVRNIISFANIKKQQFNTIWWNMKPLFSA
jgi:hypothetical protein